MLNKNRVCNFLLYESGLLGRIHSVKIYVANLENRQDLSASLFLRYIIVYDSHQQKPYTFVVYKRVGCDANKEASVYEFVVSSSAELASLGHLFLIKFEHFFIDIFPFTSVHFSGYYSHIPKFARSQIIIFVLCSLSLINENFLIENFSIDIGKYEIFIIKE